MYKSDFSRSGRLFCRKPAAVFVESRSHVWPARCKDSKILLRGTDTGVPCRENGKGIRLRKVGKVGGCSGLPQFKTRLTISPWLRVFRTTEVGATAEQGDRRRLKWGRGARSAPVVFPSPSLNATGGKQQAEKAGEANRSKSLPTPS